MKKECVAHHSKYFKAGSHRKTKNVMRIKYSKNMGLCHFGVTNKVRQKYCIKHSAFAVFL